MAFLLAPKAGQRKDYRELTPGERDELHRWLVDHRVDYTRVPVYAQFERDDATGEWRIPVYWVDDDGRMRLDETGNDVRQHVIRRRELRPLPWPAYEPPRVWINGVEITGVLDIQFGDDD